MIRYVSRFLRRFRREDDGNMTIEFVVFVPLVLTIFISSLEMGIFSMRQMFLDRAVDVAVRNVRLNTGNNITHADLRTMICDYSGFLHNCETELNISLNPVDVRNFGGPTGQPSDCVNTYPEISPLRNFVLGGDNQLMLIVACFKFTPVFATTGLGYAFDSSTHESRMYAFSGFVQEPS